MGAFTASPVVLLSAVEEGVASAGSGVAVSVAVAEGDELAEELGLGDLDFVGEDFELEELLLGDTVTDGKGLGVFDTDGEAAEPLEL